MRIQMYHDVSRSASSTDKQADEKRPSLEAVDAPLPVPTYFKEKETDSNDRADSVASYRSGWSVQTELTSAHTSWTEDEFDREAATKVADYFAELDACLYDNVPCTNVELTQECKDWAQAFPHYRILGKQLPFPCTETSFQLDARPPSVLLTHARASSVKKSRVTRVPSGHQTTSTTKDGELEIRGHGVAFPKKRKHDSLFDRLKSTEEEIIVAEGTYEEIIAIDRSGSDQGSPGMSQKATRNASFSRPSKGSFNEQVVDALFDQIWSDVAPVMVPFIAKLQDKQQGRKETPSDQKSIEQQTTNQKRKVDKLQRSEVQTSKSVKTRFSDSAVKPTRNSMKTKQKAPLQRRIPEKSRIVISAAPRRIPRRLQPIHSAQSESITEEGISPTTKVSDSQWIDTLPNLPGAISPKKKSTPANMAAAIMNNQDGTAELPTVLLVSPQLPRRTATATKSPSHGGIIDDLSMALEGVAIGSATPHARSPAGKMNGSVKMNKKKRVPFKV